MIQVTISSSISSFPSEIHERLCIGPITLGDLIAILPYANPTLVLEISGSDLWNALESGLSKYPAQEG
jgi:2',3'-cyclic-nucleotide 2'-phosphodiesterase (5'-nucleotidase family)